MVRTRIAGMAACAALALAGCGDRSSEDAAAPDVRNMSDAAPAPAPSATSAAQWRRSTTGAGAALRLMRDGARMMELSCPAGAGTLRVNVPAFRAIGSEERLSIGSGQTVVALVADTRGDPRLGGVTGVGEVPDELGTILAGGIGVAYGAQETGALPAVPEPDRAAFLQACRGDSAAEPAAAASACMVQDDIRLSVPALLARGTEPFWTAEIEGRCVTYTTPYNQPGNRVWTRVQDEDGTLVWTGGLGGARFALRARQAPGEGCSDGMSNRRYPWQVTVMVRGETRQGCAAPVEAR